MFDGGFPALDIRTFVRTLVFFLALVAAFALVRGIGSIRESRRIKYYRLRRGRLVTGWRMLLISLGVGGLAFLVFQFGEPMVYSYYTVTATPSLTPVPSQTPTITLTPTVTETPTVTPTLSETYTPTPTATPSVPLAVEVQFTGQVTPPAEAVFSPLRFAQGIDLAYNPISPNTEFTNPIKEMYAIFSLSLIHI